MMSYSFQSSLVGLLFLTACSTPGKMQQSLEHDPMFQFAELQAKKESYHLNRKTAMTATGSLEEDKNYDVIVYALEGSANENDIQQRLAVFTHESNRLKPFSFTIVSQKHKGSFSQLEIKNNQILLSGKRREKKDPLCCPSIPVTTTYELRGRELVPVDGIVLIE